MSRAIDRVVFQAAESLGNSLNKFYPSYGRNGLNERNLTYQLAKAFESRRNAYAFMEVPFLNAATGRYDFRIDCMLFDKDQVVFVECKRIYSPEKVDQLLVDFQRMNTNNLAPVLEKFTTRKLRARKVYRMMLSETWQKPIADWWGKCNGGRDWDRSWLPEHRGVIEVKTFNNGNTLYWLYAYEQLLFPIEATLEQTRDIKR